MRACAFALLAFALLAAACSRGGEARERCRECGMRVDGDPRFLAGATLEGRPLLFDTPKCLFRFLASAEGAAASKPWAIEYYSGERAPLDELRFVIGSDVLGPMGDDLLPVGAHAERFSRDHGGRALTRTEITSDVLRSID